MPATLADIGDGSKFGIEGSTPGTYVDVAEVKTIQLPGFMRDAQEATHLESPDGYKEYIPGRKDMTEASFTLNWVMSETDALVTAFEATSGNYQITGPNGKRLRFAGFFTAYTLPELSGDVMEATVTVRPTGKAELLAAA
jgi:predicted ester cyclase